MRSSPSESWPNLPLAAWKETYATLHMWLQIVGKIALAKRPFVNHWWHAALRVSPHGLTTGVIPLDHRCFEIEFDFIEHVLWVRLSDGVSRQLKLRPIPVAVFYAELTALLRAMDIEVHINPLPQEVPKPIPFDQDHLHASYDPEYANRLGRILVQSDRLMQQFRSGFTGKCSPVHFFWGSFDLAVTRFSGRRAPKRLDADKVTQEAYSHEVISCGFWPGSGNVEGPAYYAYAAPEPAGFSASRAIRPAAAFYNPPTYGYVLMYEDVVILPDPSQAVLAFFQSTYDAAADLGNWPCDTLERVRA